MGQIDEFYLINDSFHNFESGTILRYNGRTLCTVEYEIEICSPLTTWHKLEPNLAHYLKRKSISERLSIYQLRTFDEINKLNENQKCVFIDGKSRHECIIIARKDSVDGLCFTIYSDTINNSLDVLASDIELFTTDSVSPYNNLKTINAEQNVLDKTSSKFVNIWNYSKEECMRLNKLYTEMTSNKTKFMQQFENDDFIDCVRKTLENLPIKDKKQKGDWKFDFSILILRILCDVPRDNHYFVNKIRTNRDIMNNLQEAFDVLSKNNKLSTDEENILAYIISLYWRILTSGQNIQIPILDNMIRCFKKPYIEENIKIQIALCLSFLMDSRCDLLGEIHLFLSEAYNDNKTDEQYFTLNDILIGLGKLSFVVKSDHVLLVKLNRCVSYVIESLEPEEHTFTNEILDKLTFLVDNVASCNVDSMKLFASAKFFKMLQSIFDKFQQSDIDNLDDMTVQCVEISLSLIFALCNECADFVKTVVKNVHCIRSLKDIFNKVSAKIEQKTVLEELITMLIFIFLNILKSEENIGKEVTSKMKFLFGQEQTIPQIKIGAALCLSYLGVHRDLLDPIREYFDELLTGNIIGYPRNEILDGLERIKTMDKTIDRGSAEMKMEDPICQDQEEKSAMIESNDPFYMDPKDFENCCLLLSCPRMDLTHKDILKLIEYTIQLRNPRILSNVFNFSPNPINLDCFPNILELVISKKDSGVLLSLLNNCIISSKQYPQLILALDNSYEKEVSMAIAKQISKPSVTEPINKQLLNKCFSYLQNNDLDLFKEFLGCCSDLDANIDNTDTFLTKMAKMMNVDQIKEAMKRHKFDINKHNALGQSVICIACEQGDLDKTEYIMRIAGAKIDRDDLHKAKKEAHNITDIDKSKKMVELLEFRY